MKYIYESHLGGIFIHNDELSIEERYCETCRDCDYLIGTCETLAEFWKLMEDKCSINGSEGISLQWLFPVIVDAFELPIDVPYADYDAMSQGFCSLSDDKIINIIQNEIVSLS